jgi:mRNA (guanine-N7-)-methyltransferase
MEKNDSDSGDEFFKDYNEEKQDYMILPDNNNNNIVDDDNMDGVVEKKEEKVMINYGLYYKQFVRDPGIEGRKASRLLFLRSFNNWVKSVLINKYTYQLGRDLSVLDICCGRGGDLEKFFRSKVKLYVGSDLAEESLKNAMDRLTKLRNEKFKDFDCKCYFITEDVSDPNNHLLKKIPQEHYFDLVSCQFAMHYHFESEVRLRAFLKNVTTKLNKGGYFIGTIIDSNVMVKRLRERKYPDNKYIDEKLTFGNDFYSVKFSQKRFPKDQVFGIKYGFYLEDSLDKKGENGDIKYIEEYLVLFDMFIKICEEYDLYLVEKFNFTEFYEKHVKENFYYNLFRKMIKDLENPTIEKQWEIIQLYQAFVLRKGKVDSKYKYVPVMKANKIHLKDFKPQLITQDFE